MVYKLLNQQANFHARTMTVETVTCVCPGACELQAAHTCALLIRRCMTQLYCFALMHVCVCFRVASNMLNTSDRDGLRLSSEELSMVKLLLENCIHLLRDNYSDNIHVRYLFIFPHCTSHPLTPLLIFFVSGWLE